MTNNKKIMTNAILFSVLLLAVMTPIAGTMVDAVNENASSDALTARAEIPPAPDVLGCYYYTEATGWINTPCLTEEEMKDLPPPTVGGSAGVRGLQDSTSDIQSFGLVDIQFDTFNGESDSGRSNTWSIQTNTNQYQIGGTGDWFVVQFTEQNSGVSPGVRAACVWQINVSQQDYDNQHCIAVSLQTLSSSFHGSVEGKVLTNGNLQTQYCNHASPTECWVVVTTDDNQLGSHWRHTSGTILGIGSSSNANFVSPTSVDTAVSTGPAQSATTLTDFGTQETNNLNYIGSFTTCDFNICTRTSTTTN